MRRWGAQTLAAVGVLDDLTVTEVEDVVLDQASIEEQLVGWAEAVLVDLPPLDLPPTARSVLVLPDLDVIAEDRWPQVLRVLSADPRLRAATVTPVRLDLGDGRSRAVPSHAAWMLRTRALLGGRPGSALGRARLRPRRPVRRAAGGRRRRRRPSRARGGGCAHRAGGAARRAGGVDDLLSRLVDGSRTVTAALLADLWPLLAALDPRDVTPPARLRLGPSRVVDADGVVVVDRPEHLQAVSTDALVVPVDLAPALADVLDLDRSSEVVGSPDLDGGLEQPVPASVAALVSGLPDTWWEHEDLVVDRRHVSWWRGPDGRVHAATVDGLARGLAAAADRWDSRLLLSAVLADPDRADELVAETLLEP